MNKVAGLFIILFASSIFKSCENIKKFDPQFFRNISDGIHDILSKIFGVLQLSDQLQEADRFKLLWIMHNNLNSIALNYFKIYIDIVNASNVEIDNKTVNSLSTLNNVIEEMAQKENVITVYNSTDSFNLTGHVASHEESMMFILDFTKKFENFTLANILNKALNVRSYKEQPKRVKSSKRIRYKRKHRRNLKLWQPPNSEEENLNLSRRMSHVESTVIKKFPFIASIHALGEFVCAGAILSNHAVITAGSCLHFVYQSQKILHDDKSLKVRVGTEFPNKLGMTVSAGKVNFHPSYNPMTLDNNLAIVKLKWSLNFKWKTKNIMRVSYGKLERTLQRNLNEVTMIGWGDKDSIPQVEHLSVTHMDIVELKKCRTIYTEKYVNWRNFCGAILKKGSQTSCQRDIGSPAVIGNLLVGMVSYGPSVCAPPSAPTVYTDLTSYVDWINNTLADKPESASTQPTTTVSSTITTSLSETTTASSLNPAALGIHFRQTAKVDTPQSFNNLQTQILAKAENIVTPLQNTYPEAVKLLSFLLKQIVNNNMRADDKIQPKEESKSKEDSKEETLEKLHTAAMGDQLSSSEENNFKRPKTYQSNGDINDTEQETTDLQDIPRTTGMVPSSETDYSDELESEDFYFSENDGLSISLESSNTSYTPPKIKTSSPSPASKPPKSKEIHTSTSKKKNKIDKANTYSRAKKKIKNFKELQQVLDKEMDAKQEEKLKYEEEMEEAQRKKQKQAEEDSDDEEITKTEIEELIDEVKNKKKPSEPASSIEKVDKKSSIRKLIEEILKKQEKSQVQNETWKKVPKEPNLDYNEKKDDESLEEDEKKKANDVKTTKVPSSSTTKHKPKKLKQDSTKNKKKAVNNKETLSNEGEIKKKKKHTPHKQTSDKKKNENRSIKSAAEGILSKNFKIDEKVSKKVKKPKTTATSLKTTTHKTTRKRTFEFKAEELSATKRTELESYDTNLSTASSTSDESISSDMKLPPSDIFKRKTTRPESRDQLEIPTEIEDGSPMLLPLGLADFQVATIDRLITTTLDPLLNGEIIIGEDDISNNNDDKLATRGIMTIDDLNIKMEIPEEWAFRRRLNTTTVSSLEEYIKIHRDWKKNLK